jgi:putative GTP pyrophosphokinase
MTELSFLAAYAKYHREILAPTREEIMSVTEEWRVADYWRGYVVRQRAALPSPIHRVYSRIKRPESLVDKILRKPRDFPNGLAPESFCRMTDTIGVRVVTHFLGDLKIVDKEIRKNPAFEVSKSIEPVAYLDKELAQRLGLSHIRQEKKESGYASVHYLLRLTESTIPIEQRPWFELQLRTITEETWGEVEHQLGYKPEKHTNFAVRKQFEIISQHLAAIDEHFNFLSEELERYQGEAAFADADPLNAENLPPALSQYGLGCAQREVDGMLKLLFSRGVSTVAELRSVVSNRRIELIRAEYYRRMTREPDNFEIVANLANLKECASQDQEIAQIDAQIDFNDTWYRLKRGDSPVPPAEADR